MSAVGMLDIMSDVLSVLKGRCDPEKGEVCAQFFRSLWHVWLFKVAEIRSRHVRSERWRVLFHVGKTSKLLMIGTNLFNYILKSSICQVF